MAENKVLRDMAGVPANYGIDREKVKLMDREKIDDFKKLIRVLQEDNYRLEEERAKLKHSLKQQSMMYSCKTPDQRYQQFNLSADQIARVDEFVWKLTKSGEGATDPSDFYALKKENEKLKTEMEALNSKGFDFIKGHMENLFKDMSGKGTGSFTPEQFEKIRADNDELKRLILGIVQGKGDSFGTSVSFPIQQSSTMPYNPRMQPPEPRVNPDGTITRAHSYKYGNDLVVTGKNGEEKGIDANDAYDNAFLQTQLQECFEMIYRKDELLKTQKREIDALYQRIKKYLYMQDHLYKDYVDMEKSHAKVVDDLKVEARNSKEELTLTLEKVKKLETLVANLEARGTSNED
jgi:hypothetical protein